MEQPTTLSKLDLAIQALRKFASHPDKKTRENLVAVWPLLILYKSKPDNEQRLFNLREKLLEILKDEKELPADLNEPCFAGIVYEISLILAVEHPLNEEKDPLCCPISCNEIELDNRIYVSTGYCFDIHSLANACRSNAQNAFIDLYSRKPYHPRDLLRILQLCDTKNINFDTSTTNTILSILDELQDALSARAHGEQTTAQIVCWLIRELIPLIRSDATRDEELQEKLETAQNALSSSDAHRDTIQEALSLLNKKLNSFGQAPAADMAKEDALIILLQQQLPRLMNDLRLGLFSPVEPQEDLAQQQLRRQLQLIYATDQDPLFALVAEFQLGPDEFPELPVDPVETALIIAAADAPFKARLEGFIGRYAPAPLNGGAINNNGAAAANAQPQRQLAAVADAQQQRQQPAGAPAQQQLAAYRARMAQEQQAGRRRASCFRTPDLQNLKTFCSRTGKAAFTTFWPSDRERWGRGQKYLLVSLIPFVGGTVFSLIPVINTLTLQSVFTSMSIKLALGATLGALTLPYLLFAASTLLATIGAIYALSAMSYFMQASNNNAPATRQLN